MARTDEQNELMREARKEKILIEALHQFSAKGLSATRIQDIAEGAGMSRGLLYHYYPSKEAIYLDMISDALDKTKQAALAVRNMDTTAKEKILFALRELFQTVESSDRFRQTCRLISQAVNSSDMPAEAQNVIKKKRELPYQIVADIFRQGQAEGSIVDGDPDDLATLFWAGINGLSIYYATLDQIESVPDYKLFGAMFLKG